MKQFDPKSLSSITLDPGVYLMKDCEGNVLYVGKAKSLRKRLQQYFSPGRDERAMIPYLTSQVSSIETIVTLSEKDALLLENTLIKRHHPKYNVLLKDDKTFVNLLINDAHPYPMLKIIRHRNLRGEKGLTFGPYLSAFAARKAVDVMNRTFLLRQCSDRELQSRSRPCILHAIGRCLAPCVQNCTKTRYREEVNRAIAFLKGQDRTLFKDLQEEMERASAKMEFEKAQSLLETITQLKEIIDHHQIVALGGRSDRDVFALHKEKEQKLLAKLLFREGDLIDAHSYPLDEVVEDQEQIWETFLLQHYTEELYVPKEIVLPLSLKNGPILEEIFSERKKEKVELLFPKRGEKRQQLLLAKKNAAAFFHRALHLSQKRENLLLELQEVAGLLRYPLRIECFDASHLGGRDPVVSMVGFYKGRRDRSQTRHFKIEKAKGGDDYGALREALTRHYKKRKEEGNLPDLLLIDGGKGHLQVAKQVLSHLEIISIDLLAIAKDKGKHDKGLTQEKLFALHQKEPILLVSRSPLLFFLQQIRDEAHRVVLSFQKKRRKKQTFHSSLDTIRGIGLKKKAKLLSFFGSVKKAAQAPREELKRIAKLTDREIDDLYALSFETRKN